MKINLGDKVKDTVTGYTGIAIARTQWLQGCDRILVQAPVLADSKIPDDRAFDEPQLKILKRAAIKSPENKKTGGPQRDASAYRK